MASQRNKFVVAELFSNSDGKTSGSGFVGIMVGTLGCVAFATATVGYIFNLPNTIDVMQQSSIFIGAASALLAARKFSPSPTIIDNSQSNTIDCSQQTAIENQQAINDAAFAQSIEQKAEIDALPHVVDNTPDNTNL